MFRPQGAACDMGAIEATETHTADLRDAISAMKVLVGMREGAYYTGTDVNMDGKIGFEEVIHILQMISELQP